MSETVNLPALGESVTEGTVTRWLKQVGDEVAVDEPLLEVSTDKVDTEVPSPVAGVIEKILVEEDEDVEVGGALVVIGDGSGDSGSDDAAAQDDAPAEASEEPSEQKSEPEQAPKADTKQASGNSVEVILPALGESVTEGTVTRWLKQVGETIEVDEPLLEVSTDKVDTEVPSPVAGTLLEIKVQEDEDAEVGQVLALVGDESAAGSSDSDNGSSDQSGETKAEEVEDAATTADSGENTEQAAETKTEQAPKADTKQASGNSVEVTLPALGESVTEGTVTRWLKQVGETIEVDEPLLEVSTDKVDTEVPSPVAGTLLEIKVQEDEDAEVGQVLALVGDESAAGSSDSDNGSSDNGSSDQSGETKAEEVEDAATTADSGENTEQAAEAKTSQASKPAAEAPKAEQTPSKPAESAPSAGKDVPGYVTPLVRKLAREKNVDLSTISGTGVGGRIRKQDVLAAAEKSEKSAAPAIADTGADMSPAVATQGSGKAAPAAAPAADPKRGTTEKAPRIRMTIAKRMRESLEVSAQLTQVTEVDMTRVAQLRQKAKDQFQKREGAKLTFMPFFAKAVAEALQAHPVLNATFKEDSKEIVYNSSEDIAIAVDTPRGLLVPVVKNAGDLNLGGLAKQIAELGGAAKDGSISPDALTGGTFTITNIGSFGALFDTPIINQPQVGILGTGSIVKRPMVITDADGNDTIAIRHMCYLSLTYDHRLVDGADAGRFLSTLKKRLEAGQFESEVGL
ncbi:MULTISPECIES: 2-oxoglutarate dehydrogenase, E2 component, dihydrolipoamide succinyltransferase [unclassified Kocuria]|uniref:2-oxoglutarate dehydrogenase, E2 component, dihydrolipoamide succinyltransferase n=1 Tax=unclassified Kocuria TaxID=2649579 RepID=UPI000F86D66B|nr:MULTISPECIES: 2-oxoglutarate dehydrogenase, E2 component, dihydrolipoamide succinyltransferase [unclassified Kocuria]RUP84801.1 2-oxoglutarate dehydrogenase, E2 component, dihydrolipoamide succinyltransferase [Kocuria sp. HSID17590]RUQ04563.1 2-oxoglutarate dehydrogenase, E2 component, dihydrolipoamide succinyltransferase [Kocuria sp. HSID17582]